MDRFREFGHETLGCFDPGAPDHVCVKDARKAAAKWIDQLVAQREAKLRAADPKRLPVFQWQDREFEVDAKRGTMTYLNSPGQSVPLALQIIHTTDQAHPGRRVPSKVEGGTWVRVGSAAAAKEAKIGPFNPLSAQSGSTRAATGWATPRDSASDYSLWVSPQRGLRSQP